MFEPYWLCVQKLASCAQEAGEPFILKVVVSLSKHVGTGGIGGGAGGAGGEGGAGGGSGWPVQLGLEEVPTATTAVSVAPPREKSHVLIYRAFPEVEPGTCNAHHIVTVPRRQWALGTDGERADGSTGGCGHSVWAAAAQLIAWR
jgi:hypothetical protein